LQKATLRWKEIEQKAFDCLRDKLKNAPFMQYPNDTGVFTLETDASTKSIGYILMQSRPNEPDGIVACGGSSLRGPEFTCTVTELEMLSIVDALNKYKHFLLGRHFIIKSDHIRLLFINSLKDSSTVRLFCWSLMIQGFDFKLVYVKGSSYTIADSLSRRDYSECTDSTMDKLNQDQSVHTIGHEVYDISEELGKEFREFVIKRLSYLLLPGTRNEDINVSAGGHILLGDVVDWLEKDCGIMVTEDDIKSTVALYMQSRLETANDIIYACSKQGQDGAGEREDFLMQKAAKNLLWKHGSSQNAFSAHARPDPALNVIGQAVGVSLNTDVASIIITGVGFPLWSINRPTNSMWCARCFCGRAETKGGRPAIFGGHPVRKEPIKEITVGGNVLDGPKRT